MNLREKWGDLYPGFMLMLGAEIHLTKEKADAAMEVISNKYAGRQDHLNIDINKFHIDLKKEDVKMGCAPKYIESINRPDTMDMSEKILAIWQGHL